MKTLLLKRWRKNYVKAKNWTPSKSPTYPSQNKKSSSRTSNGSSPHVSDSLHNGSTPPRLKGHDILRSWVSYFDRQKTANSSVTIGGSREVSDSRRSVKNDGLSCVVTLNQGTSLHLNLYFFKTLCKKIAT